MKLKLTALAITILALSGTIVSFATQPSVALEVEPSQGINDGPPPPRR